MPILSIVAWLIVFILGLSFIHALCNSLRPLEKLGFALPVGMGLSSVYMFILNLAGISVNNIPVLLGGELLLCVAFGFWSYKKHGGVKMDVPTLTKGMENPGWDIAYYLVMAVIVLVVIMIGIKSVIWPLASYDAVTGYDLLGKIIAAEGTINNSVFDKLNSLENNRTGYPPLYPYNLAFARITGMINPQATSIFWYAPMAVCFYALLRKYITPLGSAIVTLILISAPDYADFSSISSNNTPMAFYSGLGLICIYVWYDKGLIDYFRLGTVLSAFGMWDRLEAIFFVLPAMLLVFIRCRQQRKYMNLITFSAISLIPVIVWELYLKFVLDAIVNIDVRMYLFWDLERIQIMARQVGDTTFSTLYWGIAINLCLILIVINLILTLLMRKRDNWMLLICTGISWILYMVLFYQMEADFERVGWLLYSYKRGLYSYLPILLFGTAILYITAYGFGHNNLFRGEQMKPVTTDHPLSG